MSRIEQLIDEIEEYIDSCRFQPLSNTKIIVNKEEMDELLVELRLRVPEEIQKYQKIISQQDAILNNARTEAAKMIKDAKDQTQEMVSENEIMQQAYNQANELVAQAKAQADSIVNNATEEANNIRINAIRYTDEMLSGLEQIITNSAQGAKENYEGLLNSLNNSYQIVSGNREELSRAFGGENQGAAPNSGQDAGAASAVDAADQSKDTQQADESSAEK